ncbi:SH3 domain-containing protein [Porcipelethomonas sp.]|uniref:SH3 domain-containing protein n=1 Tax=Porcipelethomonas sp. TaxID=2981675 RepID=UPI00307AF29C
MFCPECGYKNKDENKFCLSCGKSLAPKKQMEKQSDFDYDPVFEEEKRKDQILESVAQAMSLDTLKSYGDALKLLNSITDWKDANELKKQCEEKIEELQREKLILRKKRIKLAVFISAPIAVLLIIAVIVGILITPKLKYDEATEYLDNSDYSKASEIFEEIKDYKDSATALNYISTLDGSITDYDKKVEILESLGDYRDSAKILLDLKYEKAAEFAADKNYLEAVNLIDSLGDYGDPNGIKQSIRKKAVGYFDDRKFSEAAEIFLILGKYEDSEEYLEKIYEQAGTYFKDKKFKYATAVYMSLGDYKNSIDKLEELYKKSLDYIDKEKYADAALILTNMKNYSDAEEKLEFLYNKALSLIGYGKYSDASSILENLKDFSNSNEKLAELNEKLDKLYNDAVKMSSNNYEEAIKLFEELDGYKDSKDKIKDLENKIEKREEDKKNADTYEMKGTTAWVVIDNGYLNVRKSANSDAASVGKLYNGDEVTIQATSGNGKWYKVTSGNITGYCSVDYISLAKSSKSKLIGSWVLYLSGKVHINIAHINQESFSISCRISAGASETYTYTMSGTRTDDDYIIYNDSRNGYVYMVNDQLYWYDSEFGESGPYIRE